MTWSISLTGHAGNPTAQPLPKDATPKVQPIPGRPMEPQAPTPTPSTETAALDAAVIKLKLIAKDLRDAGHAATGSATYPDANGKPQTITL